MELTEKKIEEMIEGGRRAQRKINDLLKSAENDLELIAILEMGRILFEKNINNIKSDEDSKQTQFTIFLQSVYRDIIETEEINPKEFRKNE